MHFLVYVRTDCGKLNLYRILVVCDELAVPRILSAVGVQSLVCQVEHAPERNRVLRRIKRLKDKVVCRQLVGDGGGSHGCPALSYVLACGDHRTFFGHSAAYRAMFIARISVIVEGRRHIAGQLPVCVVRGFVAVDCASRIFAGIPVRIVVVFPSRSVKVMLCNDKLDGCGRFNVPRAKL